MATIRAFEDLDIWQIAREFSKVVYEITNRESLSKDFSFKNQIRSSSGSMMDNVAEGFERGGRKEFIQFLVIAKGSAGEARSQLFRAVDQNYITEDEFISAKNMVKGFSSRTQRLIEYLNKTEFKGVRYKVEESEIEYSEHDLNLQHLDQL
jgi:four helix bundle protein